MNILVGMSGGIDSTCAAYLLKQQGHHVEGAAVKMHEYTDLDGACRAAEALGIPLHILDWRQTFQQAVVEPFMEEYIAGRTPNPCVFCNPAVKFQSLCAFAEEKGFDRISTGHYCAVGQENGRYFLRRAADLRKDQSYVLWGLTQRQLALLHLPLAGREKESLRALAAELNFPCADQPESQEICFIPDHDYAAFIEARRGKLPEGNFVDAAGNIVGRHKGILHYTVGQRKGLGLSLGRPVFISAINPAANTITVADAGGEYAPSMTVGALNFQKLPPESTGEIRARVKVRYSAQPAACTLKLSGQRAEAVFDAPVRAVTPGQSAVFYAMESEDILAGGIIC